MPQLSDPYQKAQNPDCRLQLLDQETQLGQVFLKSLILTEYEPWAQEITIKVPEIKVREDQVERELDGEVWWTRSETKRGNTEV